MSSGSNDFSTIIPPTRKLPIDCRSAAVLTICWHARERGVDEVRALLDVLGLNPIEGRPGGDDDGER